ncbi:class-III pyridoxal-phosphate-dependent aminotransferase [Rhabdothermincola sediminis]|uniref:class-III pyridoxal-phosphate-dependent aminotransferase n=1 Tax=Rhabdothermincola sediminis TaxID=2751370 RepID=UPI001AA08273|nr:aminotransferase class III-fold pyridoxal phosphate-dependent enzyme [Rhabdothermincola sediminis]
MGYEPPPGTGAIKAATLRRSHRYLMPHRVESFDRMGVSFVIDRREGYRLWDLDGRELLDLHLNGGTFNLGHRHPALVAALIEGLERYDIGNHHFPSEPRSLLAEALADASPAGALRKVVLCPSGSEAIDVAIRSARHATGRRRVVAYDGAFHGRSGLSGAAGDDRAARLFHSESSDFAVVPFDDLDAAEAALAGNDVAAFLCEVLPATAGFLMPSDGYLTGLRELCDRHGTMLVADEVQTGLGRTGGLWAIEGFGVVPDILVTGKGLSGGLYPVAAVLLQERAAGWMHEDGWAYVSTFGGSELGAVVARRALELSADPATLANVTAVSEAYGRGFADLQRGYPFLAEVRRRGVVMALRFDHPWGGITMARHLFEAGVWAMFCGFDLSALQWKPGLLVDEAFVAESLERFERALAAASDEVAAGRTPA